MRGLRTHLSQLAMWRRSDIWMDFAAHIGAFNWRRWIWLTTFGFFLAPARLEIGGDRECRRKGLGISFDGTLYEIDGHHGSVEGFWQQ